MAASPVVDEITGIAKNDEWYRPGMPEYCCVYSYNITLTSNWLDTLTYDLDVDLTT
jgi:hypothetical protein